MKYFIALLILLSVLLISNQSFAEAASQNSVSQTKNSDLKNVLKTTSYVLVPTLVIGFWQWDWGGFEFNSGDEGFFQETTDYGGADKMGHFYSSYLISDLLAKKFINDGIKKDKAAIYGASSAFILTSLVEIGDATTKKYGFSVQDQIMNSAGALASYILLTNPTLDKKFDFKIDYLPTINGITSKGRIVDDYDRARYIASIKLSGFDFARNNFLRFIEVQTSYRATGYIDEEFNKSRDIGIGLALNVSEVLSHFFGNKTNKYTSGFFQYYQPRYTYVVHDHDLND